MQPEHLGIDVFFGDLPPMKFVEEYFPTKALISHNNAVLPCLHSSALLSETPFSILRKAKLRPIRLWKDNVSKLVRVEDAIEGYRRGGAIYIAGAEEVYPDLTPYLQIICRELGIPVGWASCSIFMSPKGASVPLHFDHDFGFNLLLKGRKKWFIAENTVVKWPTVGFDSNGEALPELSRYLSADGIDVPKCGEQIETAPGSVCFLPRGYWHSTLAHEDCIAVDFAISPINWADHIAACLRDQLVLLPWARESVYGIASGTPFSEAYATRRDEMILGVIEACRALSRTIK